MNLLNNLTNFVNGLSMDNLLNYGLIAVAVVIGIMVINALNISTNNYGRRHIGRSRR